MNAKQTVLPTEEPITLAEAKMHLKLDSETFAGNVGTFQSIVPASHPIYELLTLDVAPGGAWIVGDTITGATSHESCKIAVVLTTKTYYVYNRSGAFSLDEVLSNGTFTADQGAAFPTITAGGYYLIGTGIDVLGKTAIVNLNAGTVGAGGTIDAKLQDSDDNITYTDVTGGAFTQVTAANDNAIQEKAYTGAKQYLRVVAKVLVAACEFSSEVIVNAATTPEDSLVTDIITASREWVEGYLRRQIMPATWDLYLQDWPGSFNQGRERNRAFYNGYNNHNYNLQALAIILPFGNLISVDSFKYKDCNGTETALVENTDYIVQKNGEFYGKLILPYGRLWPVTVLYPSNPITITFTCGWATAADVPRSIKSAIKMICADLYQNREAQILEQSRALYQPNLTMEKIIYPMRLWGEL